MKNKSLFYPLSIPEEMYRYPSVFRIGKQNVYLFSLSIPEKMYFLAIFSGYKEGPCERGNLGIIVK